MMQWFEHTTTVDGYPVKWPDTFYFSFQKEYGTYVSTRMGNKYFKLLSEIYILYY